MRRKLTKTNYFSFYGQNLIRNLLVAEEGGGGLLENWWERLNFVLAKEFFSDPEASLEIIQFGYIEYEFKGRGYFLCAQAHFDFFYACMKLLFF